MPTQSRLGEGFPHPFLENRKELTRRPKGPTPDEKKGRRKFHTFTSGTHKGVLREKAEQVKRISISRKQVFQDPRLYFVVKFSAPFSSPKVSSTLKQLNAELVQTINDITVKLAVSKESYERFVEALEAGRSYISELRETTASEKIDQPLQIVMQREPEQPHPVSVEAVDLTELRSLEQLTSFLASTNAEATRLAFKSNQYAIYSSILSNEQIQSIAENVEIVESVREIPKATLEAELGPTPTATPISLASLVTALKPTPVVQLPSVCCVDSGINSGHIILQGHVTDTYDFSTSAQGPCTDHIGHRSMVSGVVVYGGSFRNNFVPQSNVIMIKGFLDVHAPIYSLIELIDRAVTLFKIRSRIFSLSFTQYGPNLSFTKALNDIVYYQDVNVVACAGNIPNAQIAQHIQNGPQYPDYIKEHGIYFPGDCQNVVTVGSFAGLDSAYFRKDSPSPFTRSGASALTAKPDVLEDGGNLNVVMSGKSVVDLNWNGVGIMSADHQNPTNMVEAAGTSCSAPAVASYVSTIVSRYQNASAFLVKAILLSSCKALEDTSHVLFDSSIQGCGRPDYYSALNSVRSRTSYLVQGSFNGNNKAAYHNYSFLFPDTADLLTLTLVCGRPSVSKGYLTFRLRKPGVKLNSNPAPLSIYGCKRGSGAYKVSSAFQSVFPVKRGGKGVWSLDIVPHLDEGPGIDMSLKYAVAITVESTKNLDVHTRIMRWLSRLQRVAVPQEVRVQS